MPRVASECSLWLVQAQDGREDGEISQLQKVHAAGQMEDDDGPVDCAAMPHLERWLVRRRVVGTGRRRGPQRLTAFRDLVVVRLEHPVLTTVSNSHQGYGIYG